MFGWWKKKPAPPAPGSLDDAALVALASRLEGAPLDVATLHAPAGLLAWLCAHGHGFDRAADAEPALRTETGIDAFAAWASEEQRAALALREPVDAWSLLGHGEQTYLYWDRSSAEVRVVELDHEERGGDVVLHDWRGGRAVLLGLWARQAPALRVEGVRRRCHCSLHGPPPGP